MEVRNPVFIIGTGRCGSTIFHDICSHHPHGTWLSPWCNKYPGKPQYNRLAMQLVDLPLPSRYMRKVIYPGEWYPFWEHYYGGFSEPCRDLGREDVSNRAKAKIRQAMEKLLIPQRNRLLIKITGWPRVGFLKEIFPDAKFIHIYRDGRAVANSWLNVRWWSGWRGPENWRWGELSPEQRRQWERFGKSFVVLAAIQWEILMTAFDQAKQTVPPDDYLEISYEDLCREPIEQFKSAMAFASLEWTPKFEATVTSFSLKSMNNKWQKDLSQTQQDMLSSSLDGILQKYGYS